MIEDFQIRFENKEKEFEKVSMENSDLDLEL